MPGGRAAAVMVCVGTIRVSSFFGNNNKKGMQKSIYETRGEKNETTEKKPRCKTEMFEEKYVKKKNNEKKVPMRKNKNKERPKTQSRFHHNSQRTKKKD